MRIVIKGKEMDAKPAEELKEKVLKEALGKTLVYEPELKLFTLSDEESENVLKDCCGKYIDELKIALIRENPGFTFTEEVVMDYEKKRREVLRKKIPISSKFLAFHEIYHAELNQYYQPSGNKRGYMPFIDECVIQSASIDQGFEERIWIERACFMYGNWPDIEFQGPQIVVDPRRCEDVQDKVETILRLYQRNKNKNMLVKYNNIFYFQRYLSFKLRPFSATILALSYTNKYDPAKAIINMRKFKFLKDSDCKSWREEVNECYRILKSSTLRY